MLILQETMNCSHVNFAMNRREFFGRFAFGLGGAALFGLLNRDAFGAAAKLGNPFRGILSGPHFPPKANRIIYLFMAGGPS
ncbi:MAG: sulfatase, partial [Verrucomicrobia bacterium]